MHIFRCFHRNLESGGSHQTCLFLVICNRPYRSRFGHCSSISYSYTFLLHTLLSTYCKMFLKGFLHWWVNLFSPTSRQSFNFFWKPSSLSQEIRIVRRLFNYASCKRTKSYSSKYVIHRSVWCTGKFAVLFGSRFGDFFLPPTRICLPGSLLFRRDHLSFRINRADSCLKEGWTNSKNIKGVVT